MNRREMLKAWPIALLGAMFGKRAETEETPEHVGPPEPERIIEHIHIYGDHATVRECSVIANGEQPGIQVEQGSWVLDAGGNKWRNPRGANTNKIYRNRVT